MFGKHGTIFYQNEPKDIETEPQNKEVVNVDQETKEKPNSGNNSVEQNSEDNMSRTQRNQERNQRKKAKFMKFQQRLPSCSPNRDSISYICETCSRPGKFDPIKAQKLGVPKGPLFCIIFIYLFIYLFIELLNLPHLLNSKTCERRIYPIGRWKNN